MKRSMPHLLHIQDAAGVCRSLERYMSWIKQCLGALLVCAAPAVALAQQSAPAAESWQFAVTAYGFLPQISGTAAFPVAATGSSFNLDQQDILDHLKMAFMGSFDAHYGPWGVFTDALYMDLGERKSNFHDFTIGRLEIPAATTSDVSLDMKSWIVTLAGEYRVFTQGHSTFDVLAGVRYLNIKNRLEWNFTGSLGSLPEVVRSGSSEISGTHFDAIVGAKGQFRFGVDARWGIPFYLDVGTGDSHFTWQGATGIAYAFQWGEVAALYRYIDYQVAASGLQRLTIGGPMVGAIIRW